MPDAPTTTPTPEGELRNRLHGSYERVAVGGLYRHRKTGGMYHVRLLALDEATCEPVVVYGDERGVNGLTWVRSLAEFTDGRFEHVE